VVGWSHGSTLYAEQEARLSQIANHNGVDPAQLLIDAATRLVEDDSRFLAGVERGIEQADRGELIPHEDVKARIERLLTS